MMKSLFLILPLLLLPLFAAAIGSERTVEATEPQPSSVGEWSAVKNVSEPHIQKLGKYAVTQNNKHTKRHLVFEKVFKAESQVVAGVNYRLRLHAKDKHVRRICQAVVWEKPWINFKNLTSFIIISRN